MSTSFSFQSELGHALISRIVQLHAPFQPHDYILEGIGALLDGRDLVAITPTGSGKTGYIAYTALVVRELTRHPESFPEIKNLATKFPENPLILAICPTNYLEYQLEDKMSAIGLKVLIINNETKDHAREQGLPDLWATAVEDLTVSILLLSPEQLTSDEFARILKNNTFYVRLYALSIDEVHLLLTWGKGFRKSFQQIGFVRSRLPDNVVLMGLTATLQGGTALKNVCQFLGLRDGEYHLIRRSNQRHDIQLVFREVGSPIDGYLFPELQWVYRRSRQTIIFCRSISLGNRIHHYLYNYDKSLNGDPRTVLSRIREYNSLSKSYNERTRLLMQSGACNIVIATSALAVGVDVEGVENVVVFGDPEDTDQLLQIIGRIRPRFQESNEHSTYQGFVYFNANARKRAQESSSNTSNAGMDNGLARLYLSKCKIDCIDDMYDNPPQDIPCTCPTCSESPLSHRKTPCSCSGCNLKLFIPNASLPSRPDTQESSEKTKKQPRISLAMRAHGTRELKKFRSQIVRRADRKLRMLPPDLFFTDGEIKLVLDNFTQLHKLDDVTRLLVQTKNKRLLPHDLELFIRLQDMKHEFENIKADQKRQKDDKKESHSQSSSSNTTQ